MSRFDQELKGSMRVSALEFTAMGFLFGAILGAIAGFIVRGCLAP